MLPVGESVNIFKSEAILFSIQLKLAMFEMTKYINLCDATTSYLGQAKTKSCL